MNGKDLDFMLFSMRDTKLTLSQKSCLICHIYRGMPASLVYVSLRFWNEKEDGESVEDFIVRKSEEAIIAIHNDLSSCSDNKRLKMADKLLRERKFLEIAKDKVKDLAYMELAKKSIQQLSDCKEGEKQAILNGKEEDALSLSQEARFLLYAYSDSIPCDPSHHEVDFLNAVKNCIKGYDEFHNLSHPDSYYDDRKPIQEDITFDCPHCQNSLVVDKRGSGLTAPCPQCGNMVGIPKSNDLAIEAPPPMPGDGTPINHPSAQNSGKLCPCCKEPINGLATRCKHCGGKTVKTSACAIWSLVLGILGTIGFLSGSDMTGLVLPSLVCGYISFYRIQRSSGGLVGKRMAKAGLIMGWGIVIIKVILDFAA